MSQLSNCRLIQLVTATYSSLNSLQVNEAYFQLQRYISTNFPKSFEQLELIMSHQKQLLDTNCKQALANIIKVTAKQVLQIFAVASKHDEDLLGKQKKLMYSIEHIFDNKEIENMFKIPIGQAYVELFLHFSADNYGRLISKSKYYFNIREDLLAICLMEAYCSSKTSLKFKFLYLEQALDLILQSFHKKLTRMKQSSESLVGSNLNIILKYISMLKEIWMTMTFQKYEDAMTKALRSEAFISVICTLTSNFVHQDITNPIFEILTNITSSLGRCKLFAEFEVIHKIIIEIAAQQYDSLLNNSKENNLEVQVASLQFLVSAIQFNIIIPHFSSYDLFFKIIYPNYLLIEKYLSEHSNNFEEIINFLEDISFRMESDCIQVLRNKLLLIICRKSEVSAVSFRNVIYCFYFGHLSSISNGEVKDIAVSYNVNQGMELWSCINTQLNAQQQILCILLQTAISVSFFISDQSFLKNIQSFMHQNHTSLFKKSERICFYFLLLYKNFMDDIFGSDQAINIRWDILRIGLDQNDGNLLQQFALQIIKDKLSQRPAFEDVQKEITAILDAIHHNQCAQFKKRLLPLAILIFRSYGSDVKQNKIMALHSDYFLQFKNSIKDATSHCSYLQLIRQFFDIQSCEHQFESFFSTFLVLTYQNLPHAQKSAEQFIEIIAKGLEMYNHCPQQAELIVLNLKIKINNWKVMESLNRVVERSKNPNIFNAIIEQITNQQFNISSALLTHNVIYYGSTYLTYQSVKRLISTVYLQRTFKKYQFNYLNGKLNLILILLLRYKWEETNHALLNEDWSELTRHLFQLFKNANQVGRQNDVGVKPFIEQVYDLIYVQENVYRWKYDIEMFLIHQLELIKSRLNDKYQFTYSNLSFISCAMNITRAYDFITHNQEGLSGTESDDSLYPRTNMERQQLAEKVIVNHFTPPLHLKECDYFLSFRRLISSLKKDDSSNNWMQKILNNVFKQEHWKNYQTIISMQRNTSGNYRQISKIKGIKQQYQQL